jgi:hypothetical protein
MTADSNGFFGLNEYAGLRQAGWLGSGALVEQAQTLNF